MNQHGLFYLSSQLQPATILVFFEPIESVYPRFPKLKFVATVSPFWNANVTPDQAYHSQLTYHQNQQYGFQSYTNPRNTQLQFFSQQSSQPQYFSQQPSQPQYFPQPSSQPQFKVPQVKKPREAKRKQKRTGKQPVFDLDEDDEDDKMASRRSITRWSNNEEILLAESWIEHSQDANIEKDQHEDIYWNLIMSDFNSRTTAPPRTKNMMTEKWTGCTVIANGLTTAYIDRYGKKIIYPHVWNILKIDPKWNAAEPIDANNLQELFGPDLREHPAGKQRAKKKQKSIETTSARGSTGLSTGGSQSESVSSLVSQDYRRKFDAAEEAYKAKKEKGPGMLQCRELEFLMIDHSSLPLAKRAIIEMKQAEIMRKYPNTNHNAAP
nr:hypothetical protein [Tanacetum cinerariifolium]